MHPQKNDSNRSSELVMLSLLPRPKGGPALQALNPFPRRGILNTGYRPWENMGGR